ncbi:MAG: glutathione S-transferase family protein [Sulfuriferula sp.]
MAACPGERLRLLHFWSSMPAQRVRLALAYKGADHELAALGHDDDATFFELGIAHADLVLCLADGSLHTDSLAILRQLDGWVGGKPVFDGLIETAAWQALLDWRQSAGHLLDRLYAPVAPAFADIGSDPAIQAAYKAQIEHRYNMSVEALSNDRYDGFSQFAAQSRLVELARHLGQQRFYAGGKFSACDLLLACDLFPLQLLDGVTMPLDLMYYIERVEKICGASLRDGLIMQH